MIKEAAIQRISDGKVWTGHRHSNVIHSIVSEGETTSVTRNEFIQGFVTNDGVFVDRKEAYKIAVACGQIPDSGEKILMSEDLY